jgi:hypothetical protein
MGKPVAALIQFLVGNGLACAGHDNCHAVGMRLRLNAWVHRCSPVASNWGYFNSPHL